MGKVYRTDKKSVQMVKARMIVPGDVVEVSGTKPPPGAGSTAPGVKHKPGSAAAHVSDGTDARHWTHD